MKRFALFVVCALFLLPGLAGAERKKDVPVTLEFFESLTYACAQEEYREKVEALGVKAQRDGTVFGLALDGIPIKRMQADFYREPSELISLSLEFEPRRSSTYMEPGPNYDAVLKLLCDRYGSDCTERFTALRHTKTWTTNRLNIWLDYFQKSRDRATRIVLNIGYENPRFPHNTQTAEPPMATPAEFVFANGEKMGMTRDQIKALREDKPQRNKGDALVYQTKLFDMDARITYVFDAQGGLTDITAKFTKTPYDPSYYIGDFERVSSACTYAHYGTPKEAQPMIWSENHKFDPRDGSTWIKAVQKGKLVYRHTWAVGDVIVTHVLQSEGGAVRHMLFCGLKSS